MVVFIYFTTDNIPLWVVVPSILFLLYYILEEYIPNGGMSYNKKKKSKKKKKKKLRSYEVKEGSHYPRNQEREWYHNREHERHQQGDWHYNPDRRQHHNEDNDYNKYNRKSLESEPNWGCNYIIIFGILFLGLIATIGFSITVLTNQGEGAIKKAFQGGSFFISLTVSLIYYFMNRAKFKSAVDTVGFFTGVSIAPPTVIGFLM